MKIDRLRFRLEKNIWQNRLNEMSWRDGFTEPMFNRLQQIIDFVCTQLNPKKTIKKNIDQVCARLTFPLRSIIRVFYLLGIGGFTIFSQFSSHDLSTHSTNVLSEITTNNCISEICTT